MATRAIVIALLGCGRLEFDAVGNGSGEHVSCVEWTSFSSPVRMAAELQSISDDWFPTPTRDGLELYFHSYRGPSAAPDLFRATRADPSEPFSIPASVRGFDTAGYEKYPTLTADGLTLIISYREAVGSDYRLYVAERASVVDDFGPPDLLASLDPPGSNAEPYLSADGLRLVYATTGNATRDLYEAVRPDRASRFGAAIALDTLDSASNEGAPTLSADGLEIVFSSDRSGGAGGLDIWTSRRSAVDQPFGPPTLIVPLSSTRDDTGLRLSEDGTTLYMSFDANVGGGDNADLWTATRTCR